MRILPASRVNDVLMAQRKQWHVLSVCREDELPMTMFAKSHCHLNCEDVCEADLPDLALERQGGGELWIPPNRGHIEAALRYAREVGTERLIVHCRAGLSRSPAISWCILLDQFGDTRRACEELFRIRPEAAPSRPIIRFGLELLNFKGTTPQQALADYESLVDARFKNAAP
jgi:predicted protein tyrosine phosphatase